MRPEILFPIFAPVTALSGVGPRIGKLIEQLAGPRLVDLLWLLPAGFVDRRPYDRISDAPAGGVATLEVTVGRHVAPRNPRMPYRVPCQDDSGETLTLVFFRGRADYLQKLLPEGERRLVSGKIEIYDGKSQIAHPDHVVTVADKDSLPRIEPVYPLTAGLGAKPLGKAISAALEKAPDLPEWLDPAFQRQQDWPEWQEALLAVHNPQSASDVEANAPARTRLAYDELLANQLALALTRERLRQRAGRAIKGDGKLRKALRDALPFQLTPSQEAACTEIDADMASPSPMLRLLQGDVGSGKTLVALSALLAAVEGGHQGGLMAPTEILARQHMETLMPLAEKIGIRISLITGRDKGKARQEKLTAMAGGEVDIVIGTHALFQSDIEFHDLALVVVDEQHRFGVHQRLRLAAKGPAVDVLVMTATPIPRTLTLTAYGDMTVSRLTEKPPGRQRIDTRVLPTSRLREVVTAVGRAIEKRARVYWVCPLIEESDKLDVAAAEDRYAHLKQIYGDRVGLIHGRMRADDKDAVMEAFIDGRLSILVATTVIEVGVDVPDATIMVIEHAERFGLAQLHQLRGRIGRGEAQSTCLLLYGENIGDIARSRMEILRETNDGFRIAEEDLRLRGAGDVLGTRQSGLPDFRLADLSAHGDLLAAARDDARLILEKDPELLSERGRSLRVLLYLFERDAAVVNLRSG